MTPPFTRRTLLGALAVTSAAVASPGLAVTGTSPFRVAEAKYRAAAKRFNSLPIDLEVTEPSQHQRELDAFIAASTDVDRAPAASWREFVDKFEHACGGGESVPFEDAIMHLLADARRLAGRV